MVAPLQPKLIGVEIDESRDDDVERGSPSRIQRDADDPVAELNWCAISRFIDAPCWNLSPAPGFTAC
jgi:hypothetical protein